MTNRHCIITEEYAGLNRSGGIGACARGLASLHVTYGYSVDVIITDMSCCLSNTPLSHVKNDGVTFIFLSDLCRGMPDVHTPVDDISKAYCVYKVLSAKDYAVVHFNEWRGSGFYCAMARRQGLFDAFVVTHLHGGSEWVRLHNMSPAELEDFEREGIEISQMENSDLVISPSDYLISWYKEQGVALPKAMQINWFLPQWAHSESSGAVADGSLKTRAVAAGSISELIFFGRHERRKGFELFVDAVGRLPSSLQPDLTFIGRFDRIDREFSGSHVFRKLHRYAGRIRFFSALGQEEAMSHILRAPDALCVMPSLIENSPCVVGECFTIGVPFLATDVGGVSELIAPESRVNCLVQPTAQALASALERVIREGMPSLVSNLIPQRIAARWDSCLKQIDAISAASFAPNFSSNPTPRVSVCVAHYERPKLLRRAIDALMAQTYENIEIIVVDDGSKRQDAHAYLNELEGQTSRFPIRVVRSSNRYLGAARNLAASHAKGEYILFHDDDNISEPNEVEVFVKAALNSGCDILTSQSWVFREGDDKTIAKRRMIEYYPIGLGGVFSFFRNRFGDANALIRRSAFEALGGFTELHGIGWEDWELFLRAYIRNFKIGVVPEPLFNYQVSAHGMLGTGDVIRNHERLYAMMDHEQPRLRSDLLRYAQRHWIQQQILDRLWAILERTPAGDIHQNLIALDPNSSEAMVKLSDLAFAIGRIADGIELGISDFHQRQKIMAIATQLERPVALAVKNKSYFTPEPGHGEPVVALRGWAFDCKGGSFAPEEIFLEEAHHEVIALMAQERPDVNEQFQLPPGLMVGFILVLKKSEQLGKVGRFISSRSPVKNSIGTCIKWGKWGTKLGAAHVDEAFPYREVKIRVPKAEDWTGKITVESELPSYAFFRSGAESYATGNRISSKVTIFSCPLNPDELSEISVIIPSEGRTDVIFE